MKNNIQTIRKTNKLTQKELANRIKISERNLQSIEAGKQDPRTSTVLKIAKALETNVEKLFLI